jgi:polyisoprenoid-binding protein YceI
MKLSTLFALSLPLALAPQAFAGSTTFKVEPGPFQVVSFVTGGDIESVEGLTNGAKSELSVDLDKPSASTGKVEIDVKTFTTGIALRDEHFRSENWLDTAKFPTATFEITKIDVKEKLAAGKKIKGKVTGKFTLHGVTKDVTAPVELTFKKSDEKLKALLKSDADALRVIATFAIKLSDFGVKVPESIVGLKVSDDVQIAVKLTAIKQ